MRLPQNFQLVPTIVELHPDQPVAPFAQQLAHQLNIDIGQIIPTMNMFALLAPHDLVYRLAGTSIVRGLYYDRPHYAFQGQGWPIPPPLPDPLGLFPQQVKEAAQKVVGPMVTKDGWIPTLETHKTLHLDILHKLGYTGKGVKVAVLDTGVDPNHPQLSGRISGMYSMVPASDPLDRQGHGSHVITTIRGKEYAAPFTGLTCKGGAPDCTLLSYKVLSDAGFGSTSDILKGMEDAVAQGARIISMSLGGDGADDEESDPMVQFINKAHETNPSVIFSIAVGNSGPDAKTIGIPACAEHALTVGSWGLLDNAVAYFSSRGSTLQAGRVKPDICGPGGGRAKAETRPKELIYSGTAFGSMLDAIEDHMVDGFASLQGTSMATPVVSAVLACWLQRLPMLKVDDIKAIFKMFGKPKTNDYGHGLIDAGWLMQALETEMR